MAGRMARETMRVFVGGEEVPGLVVYGLSAPEIAPPVLSPALWPGARIVAHTLHGPGWRVHLCDVAVAGWPDDLEAVVHRTLAQVVRAGCRVAWIDVEGAPFADPPYLFDPEHTSGCVLAWMTDDGRVRIPLRLDAPLAPVGDDDLLLLRAHAGDLLRG